MTSIKDIIKMNNKTPLFQCGNLPPQCFGARAVGTYFGTAIINTAEGIGTLPISVPAGVKQADGDYVLNQIESSLDHIQMNNGHEKDDDKLKLYNGSIAHQIEKGIVFVTDCTSFAECVISPSGRGKPYEGSEIKIPQSDYHYDEYTDSIAKRKEVTSERRIPSKIR